MQQLSGMDASFVYLETPSAPMHVAGLSIYDPSTAPGGIVTFKGILANFQERIHLARTFRQKMVQVPMNLDHPYWIEDKDFDLEFHVRHIALPKPGDWRQLCILAARLHSRMLDLSRPLWETYVIEGLDNVEGVPPGSFALLQKTHHAAIDGMSGMEMTSAIHDLTPTPEPPATTDTWQGEDDPSPMTLLGRATMNNATRPMHFGRVVARTVPGMSRVTNQLRRRQLQLPPTSAPRTRFNATVSAHRVVDARRFDLGEIRRMKTAVDGATVNDVVLAIVGGGLRAYLRDKGELPDETLLAMAPISVRSESEKGSQGNQVSSMVVSVASNVADPVERLRAVRESTHQSKELTSAVGARTLTEYSQFIPGGLAALAARTTSRFEMANRVDPTANCVVTNVPGPTRAALLRRRQTGHDVRDGPDRRRPRAHAPRHQLRQRTRHRRHIVSRDAARPRLLHAMPAELPRRTGRGDRRPNVAPAASLPSPHTGKICSELSASAISPTVGGSPIEPLTSSLASAGDGLSEGPFGCHRPARGFDQSDQFITGPSIAQDDSAVCDCGGDLGQIRPIRRPPGVAVAHGGRLGPAAGLRGHVRVRPATRRRLRLRQRHGGGRGAGAVAGRQGPHAHIADDGRRDPLGRTRAGAYGRSVAPVLRGFRSRLNPRDSQTSSCVGRDHRCPHRTASARAPVLPSAR